MPQIHQNKDARDATASASAMGAAVLQQAETWTKVQCELVSGIGEIWTRLLHWQREAIDASARSVAEISETRDIRKMLQVQQQWFEGAVRRTTSNWSELAKDAATLTWRVVCVEPKADHAQSPAPTAQNQGKQNEAPVHREVRGRSVL